ncbi:MAG TPA: 6-phosphogluconolactonase [Patescibacteria group bacterium]|nr:6-phosphogluconolactonase [Patescibacteria group bacterium]
MVDIHSYSDTATVTREASEALTQVLGENKNTPVLLLVSGGSSLNLLHSIPMDLFDAHVAVAVLDERFSKDPGVNNFLRLSQTDFYKEAVKRGVTTFESVPKDNEAIGELAKRFEDFLKAWSMAHTDGIIIALQGVGPDGHTAGIMPYADDKRTFEFYFEDSDTWVVGYDASWRNPFPLRVTVSLPFLRKVTTSIVYAVGSGKKKALDAALAPTGELYKTPARIINEMPHCLLYTDQAVGTLK